MKTATQWTASNQTGSQYLGVLEFNKPDGDSVSFEVLSQHDRLIFGGATNCGFIESGYMLTAESADGCMLSDLAAELETYYSDGPAYAPRLVCNARM